MVDAGNDNITGDDAKLGTAESPNEGKEKDEVKEAAEARESRVGGLTDSRGDALFSARQCCGAQDQNRRDPDRG